MRRAVDGVKLSPRDRLTHALIEHKGHGPILAPPDQEHPAIVTSYPRIGIGHVPDRTVTDGRKKRSPEAFILCLDRIATRKLGELLTHPALTICFDIRGQTVHKNTTPDGRHQQFTQQRDAQ